jgi:hypothetical protein
MELSTHGRLCHEHHICGALLSEDVVVGFQKLQILVDDEEESEGMLAQVIDIYSSFSIAVIISCVPEETIKQMASHNQSWMVKSLYVCSNSL